MIGHLAKVVGVIKGGAIFMDADAIEADSIKVGNINATDKNNVGIP